MHRRLSGCKRSDAAGLMIAIAYMDVTLMPLFAKRDLDFPVGLESAIVFLTANHVGRKRADLLYDLCL